MDNELLRILSEELRETKSLVIETRKIAVAAQSTATDAKRHADAAWELVILTRTQVQDELAHLKLPWWKKLFGQNS
jgi:hypothetical protein